MVTAVSTTSAGDGTTPSGSVCRCFCPLSRYVFRISYVVCIALFFMQFQTYRRPQLPINLDDNLFIWFKRWRRSRSTLCARRTTGKVHLLLIPCEHCVCISCTNRLMSMQLMSGQKYHCPVCRSDIRDIILKRFSV